MKKLHIIALSHNTSHIQYMAFKLQSPTGSLREVNNSAKPCLLESLQSWTWSTEQFYFQQLRGIAQQCTAPFKATLLVWVKLFSSAHCQAATVHSLDKWVNNTL